MSDPNTLSWEPPDAGEWDFDSAHQHTVLTATAQAVMPESMAEGFKLAFGRLGLPLSHMAAQPVNGWLYLSAFVHGVPRKGNGKEPDAIRRAPVHSARAAAEAEENDAAAPGRRRRASMSEDRPRASVRWCRSVTRMRAACHAEEKR